MNKEELDEAIAEARKALKDIYIHSELLGDLAAKLGLATDLMNRIEMQLSKQVKEVKPKTQAVLDI